MVKTVLRTVLVILILAGVFFFAIRFWESRQKPPVSAVPTPSAESEAAIRQIRVVPSPEGATLQISDVTGPVYTISPLEGGGGFFVDVTGAKLNLLQSTIPSPHALIRVIEASQMIAQEKVHSRIRVELSEAATYKDRQVGSTLHVDIVRAVASTPIPEIEPTPEPTPAPKKAIKPVSSRKKKMAKSAAVKAKPKALPKRVLPLPPLVPKKEVPPPVIEEETGLLPDELAAPPEPVAAIPTVTPLPPVIETAPQAPKVDEEIPVGEAPLDLDKLFADSQGDTPSPPIVAIPETPPKVAAIPPSADKFDSSKITQSYPALQGLSVSAEGGATMVRIGREAKMLYQIRKMANPSRVVVFFKNASNRLKPSYGAFPGTKVKKVTTEQYMGPNGAITSVTLFVEGLPRYEKVGEGEEFVLKIP